MDLRPSLEPALAAFGLPCTVTRPTPDNTPIVTSGFWQLAANDPQPYGTDFRRRDPRRVFVLPRVVVTGLPEGLSGAAVPTLPRGTAVAVAAYGGGAVRTWSVDGLENEVEDDSFRAFLSLTA